MAAIAEKARQIIADTLGAELSTITPETDLKKDINADSLEIVEIVMLLEKEFGISIPDERIERMIKVQHYIDYLEKVKPLREVYYQHAA